MRKFAVHVAVGGNGLDLQIVRNRPVNRGRNAPDIMVGKGRVGSGILPKRYIVGICAIGVRSLDEWKHWGCRITIIELP